MRLFATSAVHWENYRLADTALERARRTFDTAEGGTEDAFLTLLRSGHPPAVGIALDHWQHADALTRHGPDSPYQTHSAEVAERARELLGQPACPAGGAAAGATHASAMYVMMNAAEPRDAELVADALEATDDPKVWWPGTLAAESALDGADPPNRRLVTLLEGVVREESADESKRAGALSALGKATHPGVLDVVVWAATQPNVRLQVEAGLILAEKHLDTHRELVRRMVESWPEQGIYYMADDVREMLGES